MPGARVSRTLAAMGYSELRLRLPYTPPLHWPALEAFLMARATPGVEQVEPGVYRRTVRLDGTDALVEVKPAAGASHRLRALIRSTAPLTAQPISARLARIFDLSARPEEIDAWLARDPLLRRHVTRAPGLRVPGAWNGFELAVRAILGQQVTVAGATTLAGRLVHRFGERFESGTFGGPPDLRWHFPVPEALADADCTGIGMPGARAKAISQLATRVAQGSLSLAPDADPAETRRRLLEVPGIGGWTAEYVAMRALRDADAFPEGDLVLRRRLARGDAPLSPAAVRRRAERWRPWRAYAVMHLWRA